MDALDCRIIEALQGNFPLAENPYDIIAGKLGIDAKELLDRVCALVESGAVRRIGFSIDSRKIGYFSTLAAMRVQPEQIEPACELISQYPQITHSYLRDDVFNIWFTVIAPNSDAVGSILDDIAKTLNLSNDDVMNLPPEKLFKIDARFRFTD